MVSGPAPAVIYTLSLHDALPIWAGRAAVGDGRHRQHEDAAVRHRRELPGELDRLGTGLPRVEHAVLGRGEPVDLFPLELDARRDDEPVVLEVALADPDAPEGRPDRARRFVADPDPVPREP